MPEKSSQNSITTRMTIVAVCAFICTPLLAYAFQEKGLVANALVQTFDIKAEVLTATDFSHGAIYEVGTSGFDVKLRCPFSATGALYRACLTIQVGDVVTFKGVIPDPPGLEPWPRIDSITIETSPFE